jgi:hypothetical protein
MQRPIGLHIPVWQTPPAQHGWPAAPQGEQLPAGSHAVPLAHQ